MGHLEKTVSSIETGLAAMQTWASEGHLDAVRWKLPVVRQLLENELRGELRQLADLKTQASRDFYYCKELQKSVEALGL